MKIETKHTQQKIAETLVIIASTTTTTIIIIITTKTTTQTVFPLQERLRVNSQIYSDF